MRSKKPPKELKFKTRHLSYKLIGNSCGIYARDVLISDGIGIFEPSVSKFDLYGILDKNAPYAIGDRLFDENPNAIMFEIKK